MAKNEVDIYLAGFSGPGLDAAIALRGRLLALLPTGEEGMSYGMPVIKVSGKAIAGWAINKAHIGYYPHSSQVIDKVSGLDDYKKSKGAIQIPFDRPLSDSQLEELVSVRLRMLEI
ncbi:MAG: hypothetical protein RLZZ138_89 [Actinomycetota bacterium]|jgi:uncharacterized protein YdhG (YjbR/CyaY superfamily)